VEDVSVHATSAKVQVINLSACSVNVVSPFNKFVVDTSQVIVGDLDIRLPRQHSCHYCYVLLMKFLSSVNCVQQALISTRVS